METVIEINGLTKRYGSLVALNKLSLNVKHNTIHGFLGPNGAGKTTTIKILVGLLEPDEGIVKIFDREVHGDQPDIRLNMGYMPELPKFPKHLTAYELLDIYGRMYGMSIQERHERISELLELVGLKGREKDLIGKYSRGMLQRLGIAQALLNDPELVILDEPSQGLDPVGMVEIRDLIKRIWKEGMTVFLSSHLLFEVEQICSHVTIINRGVALISDTIQNISEKFSGISVLQVEIANLSDMIIENIRRLPFVSNIIQDGKVLNIELKTRDDVRPQISQEIIKSGGIIISMNLKGKSLEEIFMELVSKSHG
jgi:ABC-2 type transport system ATP-binding protein